MALIAAETTPPVRISAESSPSWVESTFRELDDVFLQTQTRIWLGEVLGTRLDEQMSISELLSDGELLFEVSRVIWERVVTRRMQIGHLKPFEYDPFASRKGSGRYTPYCNVDSFLKICKILGLSGIDLFSPSDVVEKKNTRKVCICVRLLSKKVRSKELQVPDFDIVTCTASMPTDMVGFIRRNLEMSNSSSSNSDSYESPHRAVTTKTRQSHLIAAFANGLSSEDVDITESNMVQSDILHVCLQDMSYEDHQQDSPIVGEHSDADSFVLSLSNRFSAEEEFEESVTPERSCVPCQLGISSGFIDHQSGADDTEFMTSSCASNLCSYEANNTASSSENEKGRKFHDNYLEVSSPVSSPSSVSGPLRVDFYDENDSGNAYVDIEVPESEKAKSEQPKELDYVTGRRDAVDRDSSYRGYDFAAERDPSESSNISDEQQEENAGDGFQKTHSAQDMKLNPDPHQDDMKPTVSEASITQDSHKKKDKLVEEKSQSRPLLKSIVSGTAILSVMFLVLRFSGRKNKRSEPATTNQKQTTSATSSGVEKRRSEGVRKAVYPAEKLKLGK